MKTLSLLLGTVGLAASLPMHSMRFQAARDLPEPVQDWEGATDYEEDAQHNFDGPLSFVHHTKFTPGKPCEAFHSCDECTGSQWAQLAGDNAQSPQGGNVCVWTRVNTATNVGGKFRIGNDGLAGDYDHWKELENDLLPVSKDGFGRNDNMNAMNAEFGAQSTSAPINGARVFFWRCVEQRDPRSEQGKRDYMCDKPENHEVMDEKTDELDDFGTEHMNGNPKHMDIASLDRAEPIYTVANELGEGEGDDSVRAGDDMVGGMSRNEYEGYPTIGAKTAVVPYPTYSGTTMVPSMIKMTLSPPGSG